MLLIKRYGAPLLLLAVLYSILYVLFGYPKPYFGVGLFAVLSLSYLIRTCDDLCDYNADKAKGRAPIGRGVLIFACCFLGIASFITSLVAKTYLMLVPLALILLQLLLADFWRNFVKPLFLPTIVTALVYDAFTPDAWVFVIAALLFVADIVIILIKKKGRDRNDPD